MKIILILLLATFGSYASSKSLCGVIAGPSFNRDTEVRPYQLSGFWLKQNTKDIRVTYGNSPELINVVERLIDEGQSLFACLDVYIIDKKPYAGKERLYARATEFRVWLNRALVHNSFKPRDQSGFLYRGKSVASEGVAQKLFDDLKKNQMNAVFVDFCYFGSWKDAMTNVHGSLKFELNRIYESGGPATLEMNIVNLTTQEVTFAHVDVCFE